MLYVEKPYKALGTCFRCQEVNEMAWKEKFAPSIRIGELVSVGPIRIVDEPENLGKGKYRVRAQKKGGGEVQFTTFEGTIGNIVDAQGANGWAVAFFSKDKDSKGNPYVNWKTVEGE